MLIPKKNCHTEAKQLNAKIEINEIENAINMKNGKSPRLYGLPVEF